MGAVLCDTHGRQIGGPLCCEHVRDASFGRAPSDEVAPDPRTVTVLTLDLIGDGSFMKETVLCHVCATRFGRVNGEVVSNVESVAKTSSPADGKALPWIAPICTPCVLRWKRGLPRK